MYQSKWAAQPPAQASAPTTSPPAPVLPPPAQTTSPRPTSSLSASAPAFSPALPLDVSTLDEFAQTGGQQDALFDDVIPVEESLQKRAEDDLFADDFTPVEKAVVEQPMPAQVPSRGRDVGHGRGRGRGRGNYQAQNEVQVPPQKPAFQQQNGLATSTHAAPTETAAPENAPTGPRQPSNPSVRGDRQGTGGVKKPKMTEEELAEKMAAIQIKNASLTAAHARAEADRASFAEREDKAKEMAGKRAKEERRDRQQMMGEREKNRIRKLKAMEGREWDAEKQGDDVTKGGGLDKMGGFAGDQRDYSDGREYLYREPRSGGRGRDSGREGRQEAQSTPRREDFPALAPRGAVHSSTERDAAKEKAGTPSNGKSWADQMEPSTPTT